MADKNYIVAIDSGTQSVRAVLFDREGKEIAISRATHEPYFSLKPGWSEQKPEDYWSKLCQVTNGLMQKINIDPKEIAGLGITTQRGTVIPVDKEGNPLRSAIIWLDQRSTPNPPPLSMLGKLLFGVAGLSDAIKYVQKHSHFQWIKINEPDVYKKTYKFAQVSGWFVKKLTGEFKDSVGMVTGMWPCDYKKLRWHTLAPAYEAFAIEKEHLFELSPPDTILGHITREASQETGLPEGLPVLVGAGDKQSELLGAGAIDSSIAVISFGTATAMEVLTKKYIADKKMRFFTWPAAYPNAWDIEMFIFRGFWMVTWFKQEFGHREALIAKERGVAPEVIFDEVVKEIPPGSMGLMLQPYWSPMVYAKYAKGSMIGFGDVHTRAHIYRAILEGMAYELRRLSEIVHKRTGVKLTEIRVGGGGSKSDVAVQIAADVFNLPTSRIATSEICALGASIDVAVATGMYGSMEEAVSSMVRIGRTFEPNSQACSIYEELYQGVYKKTYEALEPLYKKIAGITGYPPED
jgi:sugar (pentulose or hexulose) kinase